MENSPQNGDLSEPPPFNSKFSAREGWSGYEPSDTETEWQEIPRHERVRKNLTPESEGAKARTLMNKNPMALHRRHSSRFDYEISSPAKASFPSQARRRQQSKSPYKPSMPNDKPESPIIGLDVQRNISPLPKPDLGRYSSPYKSEREKSREAHSGLLEGNIGSEKLNYKRSMTAPRSTLREKQGNYGQTFQFNDGRTPSPLSKAMVQKQREASHLKTPSIGEINEMVAMAKLSKSPAGSETLIDSTGSIQADDIFLSRECTATLTQKTLVPNTDIVEDHFSTRPKMIPQRNNPYYKQSVGNDNGNMNIRGTSSIIGLSRSTTVSSSAAASRKGNGKLSASNSVTSDVSDKASAGMRKFTVNRKKSQTEGWFACMRKGSCSTRKISPEHRSIDESSYIERAFVVESLPQFWADKYQPASLNGFICHKQEAQLLKELVSQDVCPHILLKGPSGSGKKALAMALLREIFGDECWNLSHDLRLFPVQEKRPMKVAVPITSSSHHMELKVNVKVEPNAKYALMGLVKEISNIHAVTPEVSNINLKSDYKVIVLYEVDKAAENIQHMIKWIIDRYSDICKLVVCCEGDADILEPVKNRFKVITVDAPQTQEIMEVLNQIADKEDIELSMIFAAKIATKSKQNLRNAIMALEACKAHNYPFSEEQPIPLGWEETIIEISAEILSDPSHSRLFSTRWKLQKLLVDFVHPKLILQKLVEQLLKGIEASLKREVYYWHAYYDKRLPPGTTASLKLEEFVAKFMSIYRKSSSSRQYE